jgi:hypothetical protein
MCAVCSLLPLYNFLAFVVWNCYQFLIALQNLAEDKVKPRIVPSMTSVDGLSLTKNSASYSKQTSMDKVHGSDSNYTVVSLSLNYNSIKKYII